MQENQYSYTSLSQELDFLAFSSTWNRAQSLGGNADMDHTKHVTSWLTVEKDSSCWLEKAMLGQSLPMRYETQWEAEGTRKEQSEGKQGIESRIGKRGSKA